ncbi:nidogen-like domain-containing protein [Jannaschia sp. M317]|uniref:beta strand repeat-containing protein n=1 Tax=Jannaschia sp. M317 TaxID=2867011 RepID=UPI0021A61FC2|nr:nidogen-like domain-containing protein [Jannaschia sp. M317]
MVDPDLFTTVADNTLLPFGGNLIAQGDDNFEQFDISEIFEDGFSFGNRIFTELFLSTNGGVSFIDETIPFNGTFPNTEFIIAPFYDDLDNRTLPPGADPGVYFDTNTARDSIVATWVGVGIFSNNVTAPNTFQLEIMDQGEGDAEIIFRYFDMGNSRGDSFQIGAVADGAPRIFLRGGTAGDELGPASGMDTLEGNTGVAGVWQFRVIDGELQIDDLLGETLNGNNNPNTINGTNRNDVISGGGGNDTILGRLGIDRLSGDAGEDSIDGEGDDDIINGGDDNDTLKGSGGDDTLMGDAGDDRLEGGSGTNELDGGSGADQLVGTGGTSFASYRSSTTGLTANLNNTNENTGDAVGDTYTALTGIIGSGFNDQITGNNQSNELRGNAGNDAMDGDDGNDTIKGEEGDDTLIGGDGDDELSGGAGADALIGGPGRDSASYRDATMAVVADLENAGANSGEAAGDTFSSIEDLIGGSGDDSLSGTATANVISGSDGDDTLVGRGGNDTLNGDNEDDVLNGGEGADRLNGGRANDIASYEDATTGVQANLGNSAANTGEAAGDTYNSIEGLMGSAFNDTLIGDGNDNLIIGGAGDNTLNGGGGNDTLRGGTGSDAHIGGSGSDTADYSEAASGVRASLFDASGNTGEARGDTYNSIEGLMGSAFNDTLEGTSNAQMIMGLAGDDLILERGGADTIDGGEGLNTLSYENANTFVVVDLEDSTANRGAASGTTITGIQNLVGTTAADDLLGDAEANMLSGGGNVDNLNGRGGDDTLIGGAGNDQLTGGDGADSFVVETGMGNDTVTDFSLSEDSIDYSRLSSAERAAVTFSANGAGDRVITLGDGSTMTLTGVPRNVAPTGTPVVTGTAREDETLTVDTSSIADADGLGALSVQWLRAGAEIAGATGSTYVLGQDDVGAAISARVSYTDGFGSDETLTSADTAAVENVNDAPTGAVTIDGSATQGQTLTANTTTVADEDGLGSFSVQWLRGGAEIAGATGATYTLGQDDVGGAISARVSYTDGGGTAEVLTSAATAAVQNVNDAPTGAVTIAGTLAQGQSLTADTSAIADADGLGAFSIQWLRSGVEIAGATGSSYALLQADVGAAITARVSYTDGGGFAEVVTSAATGPVQNVNDAPTGAVTISGVAQVGQALTASSAAVSDDDGINPATVAGQWLRDGAAIQGATATSYTLTGDDIGSQVSFRFSYTDNFGTAESVTSVATAAVTGGLNLRGTPGPDRLVGTSGNDTIDALAGNDTIIGGAGNDQIIGGPETGDLRDVVFAGEGNDTVFGGSGNDELRGDAGNDSLIGGAGADTVIGGTGDDILTGGSFGDEIFGGDGLDFINGGFGSDRVNGGGGADRFFHLGIADHGSDWIQDYNGAEGDVLVYGGNATRDQFQINVTTTPTAGSAGVQEAFVIYRPTGDILWALVDGDGQAEINLRLGGQVFDLTA